jgi:hypothetical protein
MSLAPRSFLDGPAMQDEKIRTLVEFRCPFCGGTASAVETVPDGRGGTLHGAPACARFMALGPVEYMRAARKAGALAMS